MINVLNVRPIAFDSLGVRSMATFISTPDVNIFIDPSASLAPLRYGLPPHEVEWRKLHECVENIKNFLADVDVVVITHYHYDHHDPGNLIPLQLFNSKFLIVKDPNNKINYSQKIRASKFLKGVRDAGANIYVGDGKEFKFGKTTVTVSQPQQHGNSDKLGYVLMISLKYGDTSVGFTSDVESLLNDYSINFLQNSELVIVDGPPTYLVGSAYSKDDIDNSVKSLAKLSMKVEKVVIDHHLIRDLNYGKLLDEVRKYSEVQLMTAAEYIGVEPNLLEARRKDLYKSK
ncbi:MAG: MBL fold metallo-hydrolase [Sulfolobales archaeon]